MKTITDYTHTGVKILDLRLKKGKSEKEKFFAIIIDKLKDQVLYVNYDIFNERVKSYFLGKSIEEVGREEILKLEWNFIITQGFFYKIVDKETFEVNNSQNPNKWFVSVLEIAGDLGAFNKTFGHQITTKQTLSSEHA